MGLYKRLNRDEKAKLSDIIIDYTLSGNEGKANAIVRALDRDENLSVDEAKKQVDEGSGRYKLAD